MAKKKNGKFFGAVARNCEIKVGPTKQEVEEYFQSKGAVFQKRKRLVWFEGSVDTEREIFSFKLSEDEPCFELDETHKRRITREVDFYVAGIYKIGRKNLPGTVRDSILKLFNKGSGCCKN